MPSRQELKNAFDLNNLSVLMSRFHFSEKLNVLMIFLQIIYFKKRYQNNKGEPLYTLFYLIFCKIKKI